MGAALTCYHGITPKHDCLLCEQYRQRANQRARQRAMRALVDRHRAEFQRLFRLEISKALETS
jgi:hypothetical protein